MPFYAERKTIRKIPGTVIKAVPIPEPELIQGFGSREQVGAICRKEGFKSVFLVTDETLYGLGLHEKVVASIEAVGIRCTVFHAIDSEPTVAIVRAGRKAAIACGADCVVALGGGSVMDSAKIIAASAKHSHLPLKQFLLKFAIANGGTLPMVNIPSTAGTGAECTVGAVIKNSRGVKNSTVVVGLTISYVILDSELIVNAPKGVTVWCAIDALSHGMEGILADVSSSEEDVFKSRECVRLIMENLPVLLEDPENRDARQATLLAANYGGNAINKQLAGYVHAFAHSIGAMYHIPHGKAIAWCLLPIVKAQEHQRYGRLAELYFHCHPCNGEDAAGVAGDVTDDVAAADGLLLEVGELLDRCGLEKGCDLLRPEDFGKLVKMINADSINYSPSRTLTDNEIRMILDQIRRGF